jgi:hypothetical protein
LAAPVTITWSAVPFRRAVTRLGQQQGLAVIVDRRIDPDAPITFSARDVPLEGACRQIAHERGAAFVMLGPIAYFGPEATTAKLRALLALRTAEAQRLPVAARSVYLVPRAWQWADLATPRELLERLADEAGARVEGLDHVPHDLWAGVELPPTSLVERLVLVTAQFDLMCRIEDGGKQLVLVPIPHDLPAASEPPKVAARATPATKATKSPFVQVHTLNVDNVPLDRLLESLARQMGLELLIDRERIAAARVDLGQRASLHVERVSTEQLYRALLNPLGLDARVDAKSVSVYPRGK